MALYSLFIKALLYFLNSETLVNEYETVLIRFTHTRTTGSMLIVYAPLPSRLSYMPANAASLHLVDVCDNRISTYETSINLKTDRLLGTGFWQNESNLIQSVQKIGTLLSVNVQGIKLSSTA